MADQSTIDTIKNWYQTTAGKEADAGGLAYWTGRAESGEDLNALKGSFTDSVNTVKAQDLYTTNLGRSGDADGISYWAGEIAKGGDVTNSFKDAAKGVYQDYLTNPNSVHAGASYAGLLQSDLNGGVTAGSLTGDARSVAKTGLESDIYKNLYGVDPIKVKPVNNGVTTISSNDLTNRVVNSNTETVRGQLSGLLAEDSKVLQQARADGMRTAAERGLLNSSMAASAGEDALIRSAVNIAMPDAATYGKASDYNTALANQAVMYNADAANAAANQLRGFEYTSALNGQNNAHQAGMQSQQIASTETIEKLRLGQALSIAEMQNFTNLYQINKNDATSKYNTDAAYKQQIDNQKLGIANNIIMTNELSPDLKAQQLEALGFGRAPSRVKGADGKWKIDAGEGMAGAAYVIEDITKDLVVGAGGVDAALEGKDANKDGRVTRAELLGNNPASSTAAKASTTGTTAQLGADGGGA